MNVPSLIDLSGVVAIVASSGAVSALLQWLRDIGLDRLTQAMPDAQRNALLRALLIVLNFGAILGLALLMGNAMSGALLLSAGLTAFLGAAGSHVLYQYVQKPAPVAAATPYASPFTAAATSDASPVSASDPFAPIVLPDTDTTPAPAADAPATPASA